MKTRRVVAIAVVLGLLAYVAMAGKMEEARIAVALPSATTAAQPVQDSALLMDDVRILSSPDYEGRRTGTEGSRKAQAYIQHRFEALGLTPFGASYAKPFSFTHTSLKGLFLPGRPYQTDYPSAANLAGYIKGTRNPGRYVLVSAHYDHLGVRDGKLYPGADDNASGVAAMLAIAAHFRRHPPQNTIVFAAFDAEEIGLEGAKAFLDTLPFPRERLALMLNLDMVSRSDRNEIFAAGTSYTSAFKPLVEQVARRSAVKIKLGHDRPMLLAGSVEDWTRSSDHGPFHDEGVPFLYFGVEDHADYHTPGDTVDKINPAFYGQVAALLVDMAATLDTNLDAVAGKPGS